MAHKLLLADDSVTIQRVVKLTFADEDVNVTAVSDGQLAIERLESDPPDIVLADVDMPKRDGYEVAAYVKSRPKLAHIPVVLLTGAFEPIDQARAEAAGSTDVLAKPFEPQMVINRVKELLARKRPEGAEPVDAPRQQALALPPGPPAATPAAAVPVVTPAAPSSGPIPASRPAASEGSQLVSLDDYFDQLDAAFANLVPDTHRTDAAPPEMDGVGSAPPSAPPPTIAASSAAPVGAREDTPGKPTANPFATLSAVKAETATRPAAPAITDEVIEEVVKRVLERLSDKIIRETVADIVSQTAERLVQQEIELIKRGQ